MSNIHEDLLAEIRTQHTETKSKVVSARAAHNDAIQSSLKTAALVEKASRLHKHDLLGYLSAIMPADEVKAYMTTARVSKKRKVKADKRVLQKLGILDCAAPPARNAVTKPSLPLEVSRKVSALKKSIDKRGVASMRPDEREAVKANLEPLARLYVELERD